MGVDDRARRKYDRSPRHRKHCIGPAVQLAVYDIHKLSHQVLQPEARPQPGLRLRNMAEGRPHVSLRITSCCGRSLGGEGFGGEWLRCRVRDIRRRAPFFADLGKQPGLGRGGRPVLLRMIVGEAAGLEDDGAQFGDAAATTVVEVNLLTQRGAANGKPR